MISRSFQPLALRLLTWSVLVFGVAGLAMADLTGIPGEKKKKKSDEPFLPEAKPIQARFIIGTSVDIELDAATPRLIPVKFVIRDGPKNGTLSAIRPHPRDLHKAIVTYTHNSASGVLADRFTYACRVDEGSWSAPSSVSLTGTRADPKIEIVALTTFGRVLPGYRGTAKMTLKNSGIAPFATDMQWQAPWKGPPRIELGIGEEQSYLLTVEPTAPGTLIWETEIQPGQQLSKLRLYVECAQMFVVAPGQIKLSFDPVSGDRRGKVGVANSTDQPMKFTIEPPERVKTVREIEVGAKQSAELVISLAAGDVTPFSGELWVINEPYRERVLIDAAAEPAQAVIVTPESGSIDFGVAAKGKTVQATVVLRNVGGEPVVLASQGMPPFRVSEKDGALSIAPGQSREVVVEVKSDQVGKFSGSVHFTGTGGKLTLNTKVAVIDPSTPQPLRQKPIENPHSLRKPSAKAAGDATTFTPNAAPEVVSPTPDGKPEVKKAEPREEGQRFSRAALDVLAHLSTFGMPIGKEFINPALKPISGIMVKKQGRDELVLAWAEADPKPEKYLLEQGYRVFERSTEHWLKAWQPMPNTEVIKGEEGQHTVRVSKLVPNSRYEFRVISMDDKGMVSEPSDIHSISTLPPWKFPSWTLPGLGVLTLLGFSYLYFRLQSRKWES